MSKKSLLIVAGVGVLCLGWVVGCTKKADAPTKPDPKPDVPKVMRPVPDPGMRPPTVRTPPVKTPKSLLNCDLSGSKTHVAGKPVQVTWKLTNGGSKPVRVLGWQTPLDLVAGSLSAAAFRVERDGKPVAYKGAKVKRGAPTAKDYVAVAAGKSVTKTFDLAKSYDLSKPGKYTATLIGPLLDVVADAKVKVPRNADKLQASKLPAAKINFIITAK